MNVKVKIKIIQDVKRDCSINWRGRFESLAKSNDWNNVQMGLICYSLIRDTIKENFEE